MKKFLFSQPSAVENVIFGITIGFAVYFGLGALIMFIGSL